MQDFVHQQNWYASWFWSTYTRARRQRSLKHVGTLRGPQTRPYILNAKPKTLNPKPLLSPKSWRPPEARSVLRQHLCFFSGGLGRRRLRRSIRPTALHHVQGVGLVLGRRFLGAWINSIGVKDYHYTKKEHQNGIGSYFDCYSRC